MVFPGGPIESIAYVIALVGIPFVIIIPMAVLRQFSGLRSFTRSRFLGREINVLINAVFIPGLVAHGIILGCFIYFLSIL